MQGRRVELWHGNSAAVIGHGKSGDSVVSAFTGPGAMSSTSSTLSGFPATARFGRGSLKGATSWKPAPATAGVAAACCSQAVGRLGRCSWSRLDLRRAPKLYKDAIVIDLVLTACTRQARTGRPPCLAEITVATARACHCPLIEIEPLSQVRILGPQLFKKLFAQAAVFFFQL